MLNKEQHTGSPTPDIEQARLRELRSYHILDTPPELAFDRITRMAARRFGMPIALVSLIDHDRQWFKSRYGLDATETPRDLAFCAHAIQQKRVMVVPDATADPRFAHNPLVTDDPNIRFYAGVPLITSNGFALGTLCVIDRIPHPEFTEDQKKELAEFGSIAIDEMELRLSAQRAKQDLDALKRTQQALEEERNRAERTTQEKLQFVATISHELRTPMNGILGMAYLLSDTSLDKTQREYIDTINHSAQNLLLLINDVLDISKIEAGELIFERKSFDIKTSFIQTIKLLTPLARKKGNALLCHIDPGIPDHVTGDPGRFTQIVTNLVGNAVKFTEGGKVEAGLQYNADTDSVYCEVIDTGIGIPKDKHEAIFEKFTQGDASITQKYGGTGLGLAITKHLVDMLGGELGFKSEEGAGSHFWFTLPISLAHENALKPSSDAANSNAQLIEAERGHILIAEDHPVNLMFLTALLRKFGFRDIDSAENGLKVMEKMRLAGSQVPYDAIFMDCRMPEQDGYETTRQIRAQEKIAQTPAHIPIIAMTANAMAGDREACFESGMDEYIAKPLQPERLKDILKQWFIFPAATTASTSPASAASNAATPPMDLARLQMVTETDDEKTELLDIFFKLADTLIARMESARRDGESRQWQEAVHSLKGASGNLGMVALENLCRQAEKMPNQSYAQRSALLQNIKTELDKIKAYIVTLVHIAL